MGDDPLLSNKCFSSAIETNANRNVAFPGEHSASAPAKMHARSVAKTAALATGATVLAVAAISSPFWIKPSYYRMSGGALTCSPAFCYHMINVVDVDGDDDAERSGQGAGITKESSSAASAASLCTPEHWADIPCVHGVKNECGSYDGQSPIDLSLSEQCVEYDDDNDNDVWSARCIGASTGGTGGVRLVDNGTCTFADLTSSVSWGRSLQMSYPVTCFSPVVSLPHLDAADAEEEWELVQMHFHTGGSEHTINGERFDGELHMVHRSLTNKRKLLVIALVFVASSSANANNYDSDDYYKGNDNRDAEDAENDNLNKEYITNNLEPIVLAYESVAGKIRSSCSDARIEETFRKRVRQNGIGARYSVMNSELMEDWDISDYNIDNWLPYNLLPQWNTAEVNADDAAVEVDDDGYNDNVNAAEGNYNDDENSNKGWDDATGAFSYIGSLTTPPCTEDVRWYVTDSPLSVSPYQLLRLSNIVEGRSSPDWPSCEWRQDEISSSSSSHIGTFRPIQPFSGRQIVHHCNF